MPTRTLGTRPKSSHYSIGISLVHGQRDPLDQIDQKRGQHLYRLEFKSLFRIWFYLL